MTPRYEDGPRCLDGCGAVCDPDTFYCTCDDTCPGVRRAERGG